MGTCPPKFSDCLRPQSPNREKRKTPPLQYLQVNASLFERPLSDDPHFHSPAPQPPRRRDTTSCVGVGSLSSSKRRVKKHRCHNRNAKTGCIYSGLRHFVPQESAVNGGFFWQCRIRAGHKILCPPGAHPLRTNHPQLVLPGAQKVPGNRSETVFFKPLDSGFSARNSGATSDAGKAR